MKASALKNMEKDKKKNLLDEIRTMHLRSAAPEKVVTPDNKQTDEEIQQQLHKLAERVKELNCLYSLSNIIETPDISIEEIMRATVELLPPAWQYPHLACARIFLKDQSYETVKYRESPWRLTGDIRVKGELMGTVEVCYLQAPHPDSREPFLPEEVKLIDAVAERLGSLIEHKRVEKQQRESEEWYRNFFTTSRDCVFITSPDGMLIDFNDATMEMLGYDSREELSHVTISSIYKYPADRSVFLALIAREEYVKEFPVQLKRRDGTIIYSLINGALLRNPDGAIKAIIGTARDITKRKQAEKSLNIKGKALEKRTAELEEANIALRVLLRRIEEDKSRTAEDIQSNVNQLIMPLLKKLKQMFLNRQELNVVTLMEASIGNIVAPFINRLSAMQKTMTPKEIQVALLIRQGMKSKDIAEILDVSTGTVNTHRNNIRKKLNLKSKETRLNAYLLSLS